MLAIGERITALAPMRSCVISGIGSPNTARRCNSNPIGEEAYADFKKSDIGDIFGIKGFIFRTKTGEISVHGEEITRLSKSLQVLPEKFHRITDTDMRYRQRSVDLIMNPDGVNGSLQHIVGFHGRLYVGKRKATGTETLLQ